MVAWRYGIYLRVFTSISNEWDIECEHEKINFISPSVHVLFCLLYKLTDDGVFDDFPKISEDFPKLFRRPDERSRTFSVNFRKFRRCPKMSEDFWRLSRKSRRCCDDTPTNLSTIKETKLISEKLTISSHVKLS